MASIEDRLRGDGTIAYRVVWRDPDTKAKDYRTFDDPEEAKLLKQFLNANGNRFQLAEEALRVLRRNVPSVADIIEHHIEHLTGIQDRTKRDYRRDARLHINPHLGGIPIDALDEDRAKKWINKMDEEREDGTRMSAKTLRNVHSLLSAAIGSAIPKHRPDNPVKGLRLPEYIPEEMVFLEEGEFSLIYTHMDPQYRAFILFLVSSGVRWGEAVVLEIGDFNLTATIPTVRISKALKEREDGTKYVGTPKSRQAVRTVSLPTSLVPDLIEAFRTAPLDLGVHNGAHLVTSLGISKPADALAFTTPAGYRLHVNNFRDRYWAPAVKKASATTDSAGREIPRQRRLNKKPRVHDLRHTHASHQIAAGVDLPTLRVRLGHKDITTTVETYGHLMPKQLESSAAAAETALAGMRAPRPFLLTE